MAKLGVSATTDGKELLLHSNIVVLAVKPDVVPNVLRTVNEHEKENKEMVRWPTSIFAAVELAALFQGNLEDESVRVIPNQPCLRGATAAFTLRDGCSQIHTEIVDVLMGACGVVTESQRRILTLSHDLAGAVRPTCT